MDFRNILNRGAGRVVQQGESLTEAGVNTAKAVAKEATKDIAKQVGKRIVASLAAAAAPFVVPILVVVLPLVIILILMLAVSAGTAGELTGVNNPREPEGPEEQLPPGEIPPSTGDCAGIANTARAEIGVTEQPPGSNSGPRVDFYTDYNPEFWCSDFVSWVLWQSGNRLDPSRIPSRVAYRFDRTAGREANVLNMQSYFNSYEIGLPPGSDVQAGDIVFYDFRRCGSAGDTHNGVVVSYNRDSRTYVSVEGNVSDGVRSRTYNVSSSCIIGFGRLRNCQSAAAVLKYFDVKLARRTR